MCGQSIAYNIYATLGHTNPLFMGFLGYQNVNKWENGIYYIPMYMVPFYKDFLETYIFIRQQVVKDVE